MNFANNEAVQNAMRNDMDDYFFDVIRDAHGVAISPAQIDAIVDRILGVARAQMVG